MIRIFSTSWLTYKFDSSLLRGATTAFGITLFSTALTFLTNFGLARWLGTEGYGTYTYAFAWVTILSVVATLGLDALLMREMAKYKAQNNPEKLTRILQWATRVVFGLTAALSISLIAGLWLGLTNFTPALRTTFTLALLALPGLVLIRLYQGAMRGLAQITQAQLPQMVLQPTLFFGGLIVIYFSFGLNATLVMGIRSATILFACLWAYVLMQQSMQQTVKPNTVPSDITSLDVRQWLQGAWPLLLVDAALIFNDQISVIMIGSHLGVGATGVYDAARRITMLITFPLMAINVPLAPLIAKLHASGSRSRLQQAAKQSASVALLCSLPMVIGLLLFGPWLLAFLGPTFTAGTRTIRILAVGQLVNASLGSVGYLLNMTGHERDTARGVGITAILNLVLNLLLIPHWHVEGAALASTLSMITWNILLAIWVYRRLQIDSTAFGYAGWVKQLWTSKN